MSEAKWYVVHTYSGYENKVASSLEAVIENRNLRDLIQDVKIPVETFKKYFKKDLPPKKMEEITETALARYATFLNKQRQWER